MLFFDIFILSIKVINILFCVRNFAAYAMSSPPPPKKRRFNICEKLFEQYEAGENVDTTIIVQDWKFYVHRIVLIGVSHQFRLTLTQQKSNGVVKGMIVFPSKTSIDVAKAFIKVPKKARFY